MKATTRLKSIAMVASSFLGGIAATLAIQSSLVTMLSDLVPQDFHPISLPKGSKANYLLYVVNMEMADASNIRLEIKDPSGRTIVSQEAKKILGTGHLDWQIFVPIDLPTVTVCLTYEDDFGLFSLPRHSNWTAVPRPNAFYDHPTYKISDMTDGFTTSEVCAEDEQ